MIVSSIFILIIYNIFTIKGDDCEYSTVDGILDLKTLGYKDRPKYTDIHDITLQFLTYSFNGCFSYSTKDTCQNAAACVTDETLGTTRLIARQQGRTFSYNNGLTTMIYTDGAGTTVRVFLVCKTSESYQASRLGDRSFIFNIESKCACPGGCTNTPDKPSNGLTGGAVFVIILICIIATYLIVSVLFLRFVKHEQDINLIPNRTLWLQIGNDSVRVLSFVVKMLIPMLNLFICYLFMLLIQTIISGSPCIYDVGNGQQIDIRTLGNTNGKQPKYDNIPNTIPGPIPITFSWNGCFSYSKTDGGSCTDAAACFTDKDTGRSTIIAKQSDAKFEHEEDVNILYYHSSSMLLTVYLKCHDANEDKINGHQDSPTIFNMYLQSQCCCPNKCHYSNDESNDKSIGGGAIFLIILIAFLFVYIVGGMVFLKYTRGATGPDMIPNRLLWLSIVSYAIDGLRYCIQVIRHKSFTVDYQNI